MYGRTPVELLDIFMEIMKNSLLEYLKFQCINPIIDYDERNDNL